MRMIHRYDPVASDAICSRQIHEAIGRVIARGQFIDGPECSDLAAGLQLMFDRGAITCASGTDALTLALAALYRHVGEPDKRTVIIPAFSFTATASSVLRAGLVPSFVDIDPETMTLDYSRVEALDDVLCVLPVHLYGYVAAPPAYLTVVEDACQAYGARNPMGQLAGTLGVAAAFSFFPTKPLGCYGDGGAVIADDALIGIIKMLAHHGHGTPYHADLIGFNSRLDEIQAAILRAKMPHVESAMRARTIIAQRYNEAFTDVAWAKLPPQHDGHAWHCYVIRVDATRRDRVVSQLRCAGVDAVVQYPTPLPRMPAFRVFQSDPCPCADAAASQVLGLPIWSGMTDTQISTVVDAVRTLNP